MASISSRIMFSIFLLMRLSGVYCENMPFATFFIYPPLSISAWLSITQSEGFSLNLSPTSLSIFIVFILSKKYVPGQKPGTNTKSAVPPEFGQIMSALNPVNAGHGDAFNVAAPRRVRLSAVKTCTNRLISLPASKTYCSSSQPLSMIFNILLR